MTRYTCIQDPEQAARVHGKIQQDLDLIQREVLALLGKHLNALLLCGSFGRGEGGVVMGEQGQIRIVNDYDFTVVMDTANPFAYARLYRRFHSPLESLAKDLAIRLKVKQVDLSPKPLSYFTGFLGRPPGLRIENYEVKQGHVLVFAKRPGQDPTLTMPDWQARDIPLFEGTWLFRNRGLGLILAALYLDKTGQVHPRNFQNFMIECNKALLAAGDSLLLLRGLYDHLYENRLKTIRELDLSDLPFGRTLARSYAAALEFKLRPDFKALEKMDPAGFWNQTCTLFESVWQFFESCRLGKGFDTWTAYADLDRLEQRVNLKSFAAALLREKTLYPRHLTRILARSAPGFSVSLVPLILFSKYRPSASMMARAAAMLGLTSDPDWDQLALALIRLVHPGGEAGRVLAEAKRP